MHPLSFHVGGIFIDRKRMSLVGRHKILNREVIPNEVIVERFATLHFSLSLGLRPEIDEFSACRLIYISGILRVGMSEGKGGI